MGALVQLGIFLGINGLWLFVTLPYLGHLGKSHSDDTGTVLTGLGLWFSVSLMIMFLSAHFILVG